MRSDAGRLLLLLAIALGACSDVLPRPRGVILVSIDTLRADRLGCYGYERRTSPTLDRLAAEGTLFETCIAQAPWTLPAHATILTGLAPHHHGVVRDKHRLAEDVPSLPGILGRAGFTTRALVNSRFLGERHGLDRDFDGFQQIDERPKAGPRLTQLALKWLATREERPFFLFLHYYDVHSPYDAAEPYTRQFTGDYDGPATGETSQLQAFREGELSLDARDIAHASDLYDAEIRELDDVLDTLVRGLADLDLLDEVLLVVTSDHGEEFLEHGGVLHGRTLHGELLRVPLLMRGPGVAAGRRVAGLATQMDIVPTILGRLGVALQDAVDGIDLIEAADGAGSALQRRHVFAEADHNNERPDLLRMIRDGRFKLILDRGTGAARLFDLDADPGELSDVGADHEQLVEFLTRKIQDWRSAERAAESIGELTEEEIALLQELGYM